MTIVIGFSFPEESILGADTRAMLGFNPPQIDDEFEKVYMTGYGLISGAGFAPLVQAVSTFFAFAPPATNREAAEGIRQVVAAMQPEALAVRLTQWLTTYTTGEGEGTRAGMGFICPELNYEAQALHENSFHIIYPSGLSADDQATVRQIVQEAMDNSIIPVAPAARRDLCIQAIDRVVKLVSGLNNMVSNRYQLGYHHITEGARISDIAGRPEEVVFRDG